MARRGYIGGGRQGFQISPIDFLSGGGGEGNDVTKMAMALMGYGKGGPQDRAMEERQQQAEEMWRQGQLDISRLGETRQEKAAADELARQEAERQQHVAERAEDVAYRERQQKFGEESKVAEQRQKEQDAALGTFEKAMDKGYLTDTSGKFTTMGEEWLKDLDPKAAERLGKVAKLGQESKYQEQFKAYKKMSPKEKKKLEQPGPDTETKIEEMGGPEVYKRMLAETQAQQAQAKPNAQQAQAKPNLTPTTSFRTEISKPWQEYQAPELSELLGPSVPTPPPSGTEGLAPWLRPEAPSSGAMDWRYSGGGPSVDPGRYEKFPGSVEDLIRLSGSKPMPEQLPPATAPPVAAAPPTPLNMPQASAESISPGLNMPREQFNLIPESTDQYQPGAAFSRQGLPDLHLVPEPYQRPKADLMVDELLRRLGMPPTDVPMPTASEYPSIFQLTPGA